MENYLKELITLRTEGDIQLPSLAERRAVLVGLGSVASPEDKPSHIAGIS